ncbi:MAG: Ger(x)C family spore germination protein [Bacillota bacterium]|nr:Ger(x)C family spore germination protein [Bacillota bacterium]
MKIKKIIIPIICSMMFSGCWDNVEIDKKTFVSVIGVDVSKDINNEDVIKKLKPDDPFQETDIKRIQVTYGFPDLSQLGPNKQGTAKDKYLLSESSTMQDSLSKASVKTSRDIFLGQTKLLILSSRIMEKKEIVKEIIDYLQRNPRVNKAMYVALSEDRAEDIIKFKPITENNIETYISGIMENSKRNSTVLPVTLNELLILLDTNNNAIIPTVKLDKDKNEISMSGTSIIKDYTLKGKLTSVETSDIEMIRGKIIGGKKVIYKDGKPIEFVIEKGDRKLNISKQGDKLKIDVKVKLEGQIEQYYLTPNLMNVATINDLQTDFDKSLSDECNETAKLIQNQYKVDPMELRENVEKYHPKIWNQVKDNWEEAFKSADINVDVKTYIRRIGSAE